MTINSIQSSDPRVHAANIAKYINELKLHCREENYAKREAA